MTQLGTSRFITIAAIAVLGVAIGLLISISFQNGQKRRIAEEQLNVKEQLRPQQPSQSP
jgi:hypothetical protein